MCQKKASASYESESCLSERSECVQGAQGPCQHWKNWKILHVWSKLNHITCSHTGSTGSTFTVIHILWVHSGKPRLLDVYIMYLLKRKKMGIPKEGGRSTNSTVFPGTNPDCNPRKHTGFSFQSIFIQQLLILLQFEAPGIEQRAEQTNFPVQYSLFSSLVLL